MPRVIDDVHYLTTDEAAQRLAATPLRVLMLVREGALVGLELAGEWLVTRDSVAGCRAEGKARMAKGCASHCTSAQGCGCQAP